MFFEFETDETDSCPVWVVSERDEDIARVNPDRTWSIRWDDVLHQAYEPLTEENAALIAVCRLLLAGRDNFLTTSWDSPLQAWKNKQEVISPVLPDKKSETVFILLGDKGVVAMVHEDGAWSVDWNEVLETQIIGSKMTEQELSHAVPMLAFCDLLMAAKDNFLTKPFPVAE